MLKKGDTIKCKNAHDLVNTMMRLAKEDIETDFLYELNGEKGHWLIVTKDEKPKSDNPYQE